MKNYQELSDLPQSLKDEFPEEAQQMYLAVYRRTWEKCAAAGDSDEDDLARQADEAAMLAVRTRFARDDQGRWHQAPVGAEVDVDKLEGNAPDKD